MFSSVLLHYSNLHLVEENYWGMELKVIVLIPYKGNYVLLHIVALQWSTFKSEVRIRNKENKISYIFKVKKMESLFNITES